MASTQSTPIPSTYSKHEQPTEINDIAAADARRKRTTTAERRATHNAVERARRETLNGRFLYLASLLPNLSQIRRPSKSAIVNSSIAHINASKRHRVMAARVTNELLRETEELRREVNEWRQRAGVHKVEPRVRSESVGIVLRGELEAISISNEDIEGEDDYPYPEQMHRAAYHPMQRHAPYPPPMHNAGPIVSPTVPVHYEHNVGYAPSHQAIISSPHTALPTSPAAPPVHSPVPSHHAPFGHPSESYPISHEEKYNMGYVNAMQRAQVHPQAQWSDDSSSNSSGYHQSGSPPSSPSSFEPQPNTGSRATFEFGSYEFENGYDMVTPGSSHSSDGGYVGVPRGLVGQTMVTSSPPGMGPEHYGMMSVA
ncbi:hypothetical protein DL96DRAFT_1711614 [Flagelloscypha sp. PMI_526]|nr:hypothetical protein DL96DRAFT_1711614 [Flagelloscypha sp. PMI_526]